MSVSNGQTANETTFNAAFLSRTSDTSTAKNIQLANSATAEGTTVTSIQRAANALASTIGISVNAVYNYTITWASDIVGSANDTIKARVEAIVAKFHGTTGHTHAGSNGNGPQINLTSAVTGVLPNANTTADAANTASAIVTRDGSGNFAMGVLTAVTAKLSGFLSTAKADVASTASITQLASSTTFVKLTGSTATTVHGIAAGVDGQHLVFHNGSTQAATIKHQSGTATAADRLILPGALDLSVSANSSAEFIYDTTQSRWVQKSGSGSGGGALTVSDSRGSPANIVAGTAIAFTAGTQRIMLFVQGSGGHVDMSANPQVQAGTVVGQEMTIIGRNDDQTIKLEDGTGLSLNGEMYLGADSVLVLVWDGSVWVEFSRRD